MSAYAHQMEQQYAAASLSDDSGMSEQNIMNL
jgi:hypothetical protein